MQLGQQVLGDIGCCLLATMAIKHAEEVILDGSCKESQLVIGGLVLGVAPDMAGPGTSNWLRLSLLWCQTQGHDAEWLLWYSSRA